MAKNKQHEWYVMSSGKVNRYGYRTLVGETSTDGIHTDAYEINPVILYMHNGYPMSVGKMEIKKEDGVLLGRPTFDLDDAQGKDLDRKYHKGFMNAFSIQFDPKELSEIDVVPGQTRPTVTQSDLMEISAVNIPGDRGAARLRLDADQTIDDVLPKLKLDFSKTKDTEMIPKEIMDALQLSADGSTESAVNAINALKATSKNALSASVDTLMELGMTKGVITEDTKALYEKLAAADLGTVRSIIDDAKAKPAAEETPEGESLSAAIEKAKTENAKPAEGAKVETFESLSKSNPTELRRIKNEEPERYAKLAAEYKPGQSV